MVDNMVDNMVDKISEIAHYLSPLQHKYTRIFMNDYVQDTQCFEKFHPTVKLPDYMHTWFDPDVMELNAVPVSRDNSFFHVFLYAFHREYSSKKWTEKKRMVATFKEELSVELVPKHKSHPYLGLVDVEKIRESLADGDTPAKRVGAGGDTPAKRVGAGGDTPANECLYYISVLFGINIHVMDAIGCTSIFPALTYNPEDPTLFTYLSDDQTFHLLTIKQVNMKEPVYPYIVSSKIIPALATVSSLLPVSENKFLVASITDKTPQALRNEILKLDDTQKELLDYKKT